MLENLVRVVRPRGFIVIDDAYSEDPAEYATLVQWEEVFSSSNCKVVDQIPTDLSALAKMNEQNQRHIERRASELSARRPDLAVLLERYVADQREESAALESTLKGFTWLLQRQ